MSLVCLKATVPPIHQVSRPNAVVTSENTGIQITPMEKSDTHKFRRSSGLSGHIVLLRQNKRAILVLMAAIAGVIYLFDIYPEQQMQEFRSEPTVTETGKVIALGKQSFTVQLAQGPVTTPSTLPAHLGDTVEVRHMKEHPARVINVRRVESQ
ncbi:hypothetical protein [Paraburkholderia acidipaludis]|uniref:hypothetical protein n=1 Tax=Paraburkholderia acidipaludis TaxID=660537 RepID=UPI0012EB08CF|nr:hypothetical protein [Paraburkholderia acidipaludis]